MREKPVLKDVSSGNLEAPSGAGRGVVGVEMRTSFRNAVLVGLPISHVVRSDT